MSSLVTADNISKNIGAQDLFKDLSFSVSENMQMGIIGPNGSGKSTLLKMLAGIEEPDKGNVIRRRGIRTVYVSQVSIFDPEITAQKLIEESAAIDALDETETQIRTRQVLEAFNLGDGNYKVGNLSGGQKKRVHLATAFSREPDLLLLDEPTNHLDIESIIRLESLLLSVNYSWLIVSHDRWFLENTVSGIVEINPAIPEGILLTNGSYSDHINKRAESLEVAAKHRASLENTVRSEKKWLSRSPKARTSKGKHRSDRAHKLMDSLSLIRARDNRGKADISFVHSERKTKKLIELFNVSKKLGDLQLFSNVNIKLIAGSAVGLLGKNGSGKTTFIRVTTGELEADTGSVKHAANLQISHFSQVEEKIDQDLTLQRVLAPDGDHVIFKNRPVHITSWAKKFQFPYEMLQQPYRGLSGGEKARARLARLMLETPDILILDEPTNDLDIPFIEMLEQSLVDFSGSLIIVSHDRYMLNRLCTNFLGLDGRGNIKDYADYSQWEAEVSAETPIPNSSPDKTLDQSETQLQQKPSQLSYTEKKELESTLRKIKKRETEIEALEAKFNNPESHTNSEEYRNLCEELEAKRDEVNALYQRWEKLEELNF